MKTSVRYIFFACIAIIGLACNRMEETSPVSPTDGLELTITAGREDADPETRTVRLPDGSVQWLPGDQISIFYNNNSHGGSCFTSISSTVQTAVTEFTGKLEGITEGELFAGGNYLYGVYPYSADTRFNDGVVTISLPAAQTAVEGSFANGLFPAIARAQDVDLWFYNICGGVKFSVLRNDVTSVRFKGNNGERLAGTANVVFDAATEKPVVTEMLDDRREITIYAPNGGTFVPGKAYFIVAYPAKLSAGFTMTFCTSDKKEETYVHNSAVEIKRSVFGVLDQADKEVFSECRIIHKDGYATNGPRYYRNKFVTIEEATDYNGGRGIIVDGFQNPASIALNYKEEIDLLDYVYTYSEEYGDVVDDLLGVEYEFYFAGLDATYQEGDNVNDHVTINVDGNRAKYETTTGEKTNQNAFVKLTGEKGSVIKVNDQFVNLGTPAIGRTPLVYVRSKVNGKYLAEAFIKLVIVEEIVEVRPLGWDVFVVHDVVFDSDKLTATGTYSGDNGIAEAPRRQMVYANKDLNVNGIEFTQWILDDDAVNMPYAVFASKYDIENPKIILVRNGSTIGQPGAMLPAHPAESNNTILEDFRNISTYYPGVYGDLLRPTDWTQPGSIDIKLTNQTPADGQKHYIYVVLEALDNTRNIDVVLQFSYFLPLHEHNFTLGEWTLNPDYLLNDNPANSWRLNQTRPSDINGPADRTRYGVVQAKIRTGENRSSIIEHFKEYNVKVNPEATYFFDIVNFGTYDAFFTVYGIGSVSTIVEGGRQCSRLSISGSDLLYIVNMYAPSPEIVLSGASPFQESKEILVKVTETCNDDARQTMAGYYYVVFKGLKVTMKFNDVAFGTYSDKSDYVLVHELIDSIVDEYGNEIIKWVDGAWTIAADYADITTSILVRINKLTFPYGDSEASFGWDLYIVGPRQSPVGYNNGVVFDDEGIEWWPSGAGLQREKYFGAVVEVIVVTIDGYNIKLAVGETKLQVLSTSNSAYKNPNHQPDGEPSDPIWK